MFTWDPRVRTWIKEQGPEDAMAPIVAPIDDEAVQTYFLNVTNGRWTPTVLGLRARVIASELGTRNRRPLTPGLAYGELGATAHRKRHVSRRLALALLLVLILLLVAAIYELQLAPVSGVDPLDVLERIAANAHWRGAADVR